MKAYEKVEVQLHTFFTLSRDMCSRDGPVINLQLLRLLRIT